VEQVAVAAARDAASALPLVSRFSGAQELAGWAYRRAAATVPAVAATPFSELPVNLLWEPRAADSLSVSPVDAVRPVELVPVVASVTRSPVQSRENPVSFSEPNSARLVTCRDGHPVDV